MTRVLGLDLGLMATGYAYNDEASGVIRSKARGPRRLAEIRDAVLDFVYDSDVVVLEGYSYASQNRAHQVGELGGVIRLSLYNARVPYVEVPPAMLKKFATGKGNADKDAVLAAAIRRFGFEGDDNNAADAWILRAMGLSAYSDWNGATEYQRDALKRIDWPKLEEVIGTDRDRP